MSQLASVFAVKWQNFSLRRFLVFGIILGLMIITPRQHQGRAHW